MKDSSRLRLRSAQWALLLCALLGWMVGTTSAEARALAHVEQIAFNARSDGEGYVVRIRTTNRVTAYGIPLRTAPHQLQWTLYHARLSERFEHATPDGPVDGYSTRMEDGHLVLQFDLDPEADVQATAYRDRGSDDLLLNLAYQDSSHAPVGDIVARTPDRVPVRTASQRVEERPSRSSGPASRTSRERWKLDTVVIDPGHGGRDPGTQGSGINEKDVVLSVSKILGGYLEEKLGLNVVYTRTTDRFIELQERGHIANEAGGKLFISIHANAARSRHARGTETFFLGPHKTEAARKVMERENQVVNMENNSVQYETLDEDKLVRYALTQSMNTQQSEHLAALIEKQFENRVSRRSRGVKQAGFQVLWGASMPAVLVELGFLTNGAEAAFLTSERGQVYMASAIFRAVRDYKKDYEKGMNVARAE